MTITEAVERYAFYKHQQGVAFEKGRLRLLMWCKYLGNKPLSQVNSSDISGFLGVPKSVPSWRARHHLIRNFSQYWSFRKEMARLEMPPLPIPIRSSYVPHIYTRDEIKRLCRVAKDEQGVHPDAIDAQTKKLVILMLYSTGAFMNQVLSLEWSAVNLERNEITLQERRFKRRRTIPVIADLAKLLNKHHGRSIEGQKYVFVTRNGKLIQQHHMTQCFIRLRKAAGVVRIDKTAPAPRLHDLRATFAVNRIEEGHRRRTDMNVLLPALAAYMGLTGLLNSERYMDLVPSRFRKELKALSRATGKRHWREDPELMHFLASL